MADRTPQKLLELLRSRTLVTLDDVRGALEGASRATAFRYLAQVPYRRSYNHNGRYYALHDPTRYDRSGLWSRGDVHFSIDGSLRATVRRLVHEAEAGATHRELQERLRIRVRTTLLDLLHKGEVDRERLAEVSVYLHVDPAVREQQVRRRKDQLDAQHVTAQEAEVDDAVVIQVLLTLIRHPGSQPTEVARHLYGVVPPITLAQAQAVFARYELEKKEEA